MNEKEIPCEVENSLKIEWQRVPKIVNEYFPKVKICFSSEKALDLNEIIYDQEKREIGECFRLSYFYCLFDEDYQIAQGVSGNRRHAWCEKENIVYSPSDNALMTKKEFYEQAKIDPSSVDYYSLDEATNRTIKYGALDYKLDSDRELPKEQQAFFSDSFKSLCNKKNLLESFTWYISDTNLWSFELKIKGEDVQIFDIDKIIFEENTSTIDQ